MGYWRELYIEQHYHKRHIPVIIHDKKQDTKDYTRITGLFVFVLRLLNTYNKKKKHHSVILIEMYNPLYFKSTGT